MPKGINKHQQKNSHGSSKPNQKSRPEQVKTINAAKGNSIPPKNDVQNQAQKSAESQIGLVERFMRQHGCIKKAEITTVVINIYNLFDQANGEGTFSKKPLKKQCNIIEDEIKARGLKETNDVTKMTNRGLMDWLIDKFGYAKRNTLVNIKNLLNIDMDDESFARKPLGEQFKIIEERIKSLLDNKENIWPKSDEVIITKESPSDKEGSSETNDGNNTQTNSGCGYETPELDYNGGDIASEVGSEKGNESLDMGLGNGGEPSDEGNSTTQEELGERGVNSGVKLDKGGDGPKEDSGDGCTTTEDKLKGGEGSDMEGNDSENSPHVDTPQERNGVQVGEEDESSQSEILLQKQELEKLLGSLEGILKVETKEKPISDRICDLKLLTEEFKDIKTLIDEKTGLYGKIKKFEELIIAVEELLGKKINLNSYTKIFSDYSNEISKLKNENSTLKVNYGNLQSLYNTLETHKNLLENNFNACKARCEELESSDVATLSKTIEEKNGEIKRLDEEKRDIEEQLSTEKRERSAVASELDSTNKLLNEAKDEIVEKKKELKKEKRKLKQYEIIISEKDRTIEELNIQNEKDKNKIQEQEEEITSKQQTIVEKTNAINQLNSDKDNLNSQISILTGTIGSLENEKKSLTSAKDKAERQTLDKVEFINAERDDYAKSIMKLAESLGKASSEDFLGCCDEAFENNRISLQEKVAKPIRSLVRELGEIAPGKYASQKALEDAYYPLIKENLDSASGLTRIAQWYAYSRIPFMVDDNRSDGLYVRQTEIRTMYSLATRLLGMVGMEYRIPILFVERMPEDDVYEDVTGKRQLNIEYMCPTARSHKESIDCIDNSSVIIDVVEVGYCDNRGNNKNPQVII